MSNKVYTIGYQGRTVEQLVSILDSLGSDLLDIRFNANSPNPRWQKANLVSVLGDHYKWVKALGNAMYKTGGMQIVDYAAGKAAIEDSPRPVVLMCGCQDFETCHRKVVADMLIADGFEVEEIGDQDAPTKALTFADPHTLAIAGEVANQYAAANVLADYRQRITKNTERRQDADLRLFERYLSEAGSPAYNLATDAESWRGMTWGLIDGFVKWMLKKGYAVGSVNVRLATVKRYCDLAHKAGAIETEAHIRIRGVTGYGHKQARNVDAEREVKRTGPKKSEAVSLTKEQADLLKFQVYDIRTRAPILDTAQCRRDTLLMCLLLDHGLRCGEIALLQITDFRRLPEGVFEFYRPKVDKPQTHKLTADTLRVATAYIQQDAPAIGPLLLGSRKGGRLLGRMSERAINERVRRLGEAIGVNGLSPHDCRHYWATRAARQGTDPFALQEAGGWNSLAMPRRYVEAAKIANEGVKL